MEIIPLGTASAVPTRDRHPSAVALFRKGRVLLFDCGEGTQMRLIHAGLRPTRIDAIFITHLHGDHFFGLMGLLSTLSLLGRERPLTIVGPSGLAETIRQIPGLAEENLAFQIAFSALPETFTKAVVYEADGYAVEARPLEHRTFAAGYRFEEAPKPGHLDVEKARALGINDYAQFRALKAGEAVLTPEGRRVTPDEVVGPQQPGRSFAYVTDTMPCEGGRVLARAADLVYHDATFSDEFRVRARETGHSTARQAAEVARSAGAARLLLGHFSARHSDPSALLREARHVFKNTDVAQELKRYVV